MESNEQLILVDEYDLDVGTDDKWRIHKEGKLHRAFSIIILNSSNDMLIQKRSMMKYHSPGLWSNAVCGHPKPGEGIALAAHRRLMQEMGFNCDLRFVFKFRYCAPVGRGMIENELDHVFLGCYEGNPILNPIEVAEWKWVSNSALARELEVNPDEFTYWFRDHLWKKCITPADTSNDAERSMCELRKRA